MRQRALEDHHRRRPGRPRCRRRRGWRPAPQQGRRAAGRAARRRRRRASRRPRRRRLGGQALGEPGQDGVGALVAGVGAQHQQHQRRAAGHVASASPSGRRRRRRPTIARALRVTSSPSASLRRHGEPDQLPDPVVRRRVRRRRRRRPAGSAAGCRGCRRATSGGVDQVGAEVVARGHRAAGRLDLLRSAVTTCSSAPGTVTSATDASARRPGDHGRAERGRRRPRRSRPSPWSSPGGPHSRCSTARDGGTDVGQRSAAEDDAGRECEEDGDDGQDVVAQGDHGRIPRTLSIRSVVVLETAGASVVDPLLADRASR